MDNINIKIELKIITHQYVKENPFVSVGLNNVQHFGQVISEDTTVEIDTQIKDDTTNYLTIEYKNKDPRVDVVVGHDGSPTHDKRVEIKNISIDDIELDFHTFSQDDTLTYQSSDPNGKNTQGFQATKLAWNGTTTLKFSAPVYIWLLENL